MAIASDLAVRSNWKPPPVRNLAAGPRAILRTNSSRRSEASRSLTSSSCNDIIFPLRPARLLSSSATSSLMSCACPMLSSKSWTVRGRKTCARNISPCTCAYDEDSSSNWRTVRSRELWRPWPLSMSWCTIVRCSEIRCFDCSNATLSMYSAIRWSSSTLHICRHVSAMRFSCSCTMPAVSLRILVRSRRSVSKRPCLAEMASCACAISASQACCKSENWST
mmetsp:Transcript_44490/g.128606  ORF Transcript_44490/g.128606 Transcript_44490/m.128606 type:complete len:222 (+) Transcript_44490:232-897(+)